MDFASLKKNREALNKKLHDKVENLNSNANFQDDRFWKLQTDKSGNGNAIIRFLMAPEGEDFPFVRYWLHQFKGPGGWFWQSCLTSLGKDCPVCKANSELWNTEVKANQDVVRQRKRKLKYVSNILVIKDPKNPGNDGKVFLFEYGAKIFEKLNDLMNPQIEGEEAVNPFDFWGGANFQIIQTKGEGGFPNYDKSKFVTPGALFAGDDKKIEKLWKTEFKLSEFVNAAKFLSEEQLTTKFNKAVGNVSTKPAAETAEDLGPVALPKKKEKTKAAKDEPEVKEDASSDEEVPFDTPEDLSSEDEENLLSQFAQLAND